MADNQQQPPRQPVAGVPRVVGELREVKVDVHKPVDTFGNRYSITMIFKGGRVNIACSDGDDARAIAQQFRRLADDLDPRSPV